MGKVDLLVAGVSAAAPMEARERGQQVGWREIGGLVVLCSLSP